MMLYNERAELILQQLQLQSTVKVTELSQLLQVSVDTVRRDLKIWSRRDGSNMSGVEPVCRKIRICFPTSPAGRSSTAS